MEFDELLITTGVDALVRLVKEKQRVELTDASSQLNIPQETIEDWARVLEEESILRIEYRLAKVYLTWVKPTEDEVATETKSFYEEKKGIQEEIGQIREKSSAGSAELEALNKSFSAFYSKISGRMAELEKKISSAPGSGATSESVIAKYREELASMEARLQESRGILQSAKAEIGGAGVGKEKISTGELLARAEKSNAELVALRESMETLRRKAGDGQKEDVVLPPIKDIRKKMEEMQRDFASLRSRNAQLRQDMLSLQESTETLGSVMETIMGEEEKVESLRKQMNDLSTEAERLVKSANTVAASVKRDADVVDRVGDSINVAKGILKRFPSQEKVLAELDKLKADEDALAEKNEAAMTLLEAAGGKQVTQRELTDTMAKMEDRMTQVKRDMDALELALEDEKNTYLTFQKIKERVVPAVESYGRELDAMEQRVSKIREEGKAQLESMVTEAQRMKSTLRGTELGEVLRAAEELKEKRRMLEEIKTALEDMDNMSGNINKRITLLAREAALLEIRTGGEGAGSGGDEGGGTAEAKRKELRSQMELTKEEELEFRAKREELKKLIQKLWEQ